MANNKELVEEKEEDGRGKARGLHLSIVDNILRLKQIQDLLSDGKSVSQISDRLNISKNVVYNNISYLKELQVADLTGEDIAAKRAELFLGLTEVENEVKTQYKLFKDEKTYSTDARSYLRLWKDIIESKARMFGVDVIKTEGIVINQQINAGNGAKEVERVPSSIKDALANAIINEHEDRIKDKYDSDSI